MEILYPDLDGELKVVVFDATLKEVPSYSSTPSSHRVERTIDLTDNVRQEKDILSVEAFVSNHPIKPNVGSYAGIQGGELGGSISDLDLGSFIERRYNKGAVVSQSSRDGKPQVTAATYETQQASIVVQVLQFPFPVDRKQIVHDILLDLKKRAVEVSVGIGLKTWDSMLLTKLSPPQDDKTGSGVTFAIDFEEVLFANTETVDTPEPFETRAEHAEREGEQTEGEPTPDDRSAAQRGLDALADAGLIPGNVVFGTGPGSGQGSSH